MGKQKLKLSSVKGYREKRKARLAAREAPASNNQATDLLVLLPRVLSFKQLRDHFSKSDIPGWTVVENTAERLTLAKMKFSPSPHISESVQITSHWNIVSPLIATPSASHI